MRDDGLNQGWRAYFDDQKVTAVGPDGDVFSFKNIKVGQDLSKPHIFHIQVLPVNTRPKFEPVTVKLIQGSMGIKESQTVVFAVNVSSGSINEIQGLIFSWSWKLRYVIGWDAEHAAAGQDGASAEVSETGTTDVYKRCEEQVQNQNILSTIDRAHDMQECQKECALAPGCRYVIISNSRFPCSLASECSVVDYPESNPVISGIFEYPGALISIPPVLTANADMGCRLFTMTTSKDLLR